MMWAQPGKKLLFMGSELGTPAEWAHEATLDWSLHDRPGHRGLRRLVADLNRLYADSPALHRADCEPAGYQMVIGDDDTHSAFAWLRKDPGGSDGNAGPDVLVVVNATPTVHYGYRIGVPHAGAWDEVLNTDAEDYGGSGIGNLGVVTTEDQPWHGYDQSLAVTLPPLAVVYLCERADSRVRRRR
jgi:1,4-alpha-glucan branching enzyme